jgi:ribosomal protein S7
MIREAPTKARNLIDGASFGPEALKAVGKAFDAAWAEISNNFGDEPADVEKARVRLAKAILSIANEDSRDVAVLKRAALQRMALDYKRRG